MKIYDLCMNECNLIKKKVLGSKDLGTNVFRTLMYNVGKP